jgi:hypothetical protein
MKFAQLLHFCPTIEQNELNAIALDLTVINRFKQCWLTTTPAICMGRNYLSGLN